MHLVLWWWAWTPVAGHSCPAPAYGQGGPCPWCPCPPRWWSIFTKSGEGQLLLSVLCRACWCKGGNFDWSLPCACTWYCLVVLVWWALFLPLVTLEWGAVIAKSVLFTLVLTVVSWLLLFWSMWIGAPLFLLLWARWWMGTLLAIVCRGMPRCWAAWSDGHGHLSSHREGSRCSDCVTWPDICLLCALPLHCASFSLFPFNLLPPGFCVSAPLPGSSRKGPSFARQTAWRLLQYGPMQCPLLCSYRFT